MGDDLAVLVVALYPVALIGTFAYLFMRRMRHERGWSPKARQQRSFGPTLVLVFVLLPVALFVVLWLLRGVTS